jgi:hypothetical protein
LNKFTYTIVSLDELLIPIQPSPHWVTFSKSCIGNNYFSHTLDPIGKRSGEGEEFEVSVLKNQDHFWLRHLEPTRLDSGWQLSRASGAGMIRKHCRDTILQTDETGRDLILGRRRTAFGCSASMKSSFTAFPAAPSPRPRSFPGTYRTGRPWQWRNRSPTSALFRKAEGQCCKKCEALDAHLSRRSFR